MNQRRPLRPPPACNGTFLHRPAIAVIVPAHPVDSIASRASIAVANPGIAAQPIVAGHGGRIVKTMGDGVLLEFSSVVAAVECAIAIQKLMVERNAGFPGHHFDVLIPSPGGRDSGLPKSAAS
jgi:hypothetical protein